jgi:hypothetical protein
MSKTYKFKCTRKEFFELLTISSQFRQTIIDLFANYDCDSVYWEFPPYYANAQHLNAEFTFVNTKGFGKANINAFVEYFDKSINEIVVFPNISKDALLISVSDNKNNEYDSHIMNFMKYHPSVETKHNLLKTIGENMLCHTNNAGPIWLSTSGKGVQWLHVRISTTPKYYKCVAYTQS